MKIKISRRSRFNTSFKPAWLPVGLLVLLTACGQQPAKQAAVVTPAELCQKLVGFSVAATAIGETSSGASITSAELVAADADKNSNGEYCSVTSYHCLDTDIEIAA